MNALPSTIAEAPPATRPRLAPALPRLLAGIPPHGAMTLGEHLAVHGPVPFVRRGRRRHAREHAGMLIDEIERSGLLGHGGAAFPTAVKMRALAGARGRAIVVANAAEGEPASLKDRTLLETLPHLVLDGAIVAAEAVGADELIICACESAAAGVEGMERAIEERGPGSASAAQSPKMSLRTVPGHYVAGQESALVNYLNGGPAKPTFTPPMLFERGSPASDPDHQRRDARPRRADRAPRTRVVSSARHRLPAGVDARDPLRRGRPHRRLRDRARRVAVLADRRRRRNAR